jgi:ribosome-associated translation inhibitor RaiA
MKTRGVTVDERLHALALHKLERLERLERRVQRVEIEVIAERHRPEGHRRLEAALSIPRKTFARHAEGPDVEHALDRIVSASSDSFATTTESERNTRARGAID